MTTGMQMPFDRLVRAVAGWANETDRTDVFFQVGRGGYRPTGFESAEVMRPAEFRNRILESPLVISHAGMGSIIVTLELGRPLVVLPRRAAFAETRNDHQVETARRFGEAGRLVYAPDDHALPDILSRVIQDPRSLSFDSRTLRRQLTEHIQSFLDENRC